MKEYTKYIWNTICYINTTQRTSSVEDTNHQGFSAATENERSNSQCKTQLVDLRSNWYMRIPILRCKTHLVYRFQLVKEWSHNPSSSLFRPLHNTLISILYSSSSHLCTWPHYQTSDLLSNLHYFQSMVHDLVTW